MNAPPALPVHRDSWFAPLSIDLIFKVLRITFFHPFLAWIIPLCFRAQTMRWDAPPMVVAIIFASIVTASFFAGVFNNNLAYGMSRHVDLGDEVIVVTGGASGLGLLLAEVYGMRGASVAVLDVRDMDNTEARGVTYYKCDISNQEELARVSAEIQRDLGTPSILINNAATVLGKPLLELTNEEITRSLSVNLLAPFYAVKAFLPGMIAAENGGTIVNISSVLGHFGVANLTDYSAAKAGLSSFHRALAAELRVAGHDAHVKTILVEAGQLSTPLFHGVKTPSSFFAPVVEPVDVCNNLVRAIDGGRSGHLAFPCYAGYVGWFNVLPASIQLLARRITGIDTAMHSFVGRKETEKPKL